MPHDKNGTLLQVGDEVTIRARVTLVTEGTDRCNVSLATVEKYPGCDYGDTMTTAASLVEKAPAQATESIETGYNQASPQADGDGRDAVQAS